MNIRLLSVGKLKERYFIDACAEYEKRLSRYCRLECVEVADEKTSETLSDAAARQAVEREGERLLGKIGAGDTVIALAIGGKRMDSEGFAAYLQALMDGGKRPAFVIGGSLGLSDKVLSRADERLSLSDMTFPHRIARLVLLEQIYRACKIQRNETYHK